MGQWLSALGCVAVSLQGAVRAFAFVAIIALGLMIMFMELKGWIQDLMKVLFGISLALFAASFLNVIFPGQNFNFNCWGIGSISPPVALAFLGPVWRADRASALSLNWGAWMHDRRKLVFGACLALFAAAFAHTLLPDQVFGSCAATH